MEWIEYKTRNLKGAYLYAPDTKEPLPLVIWLTGGNDGSQLPLKFSLGKLLNDGKLNPDYCAVLMPSASYGHNYTTMTTEELETLVHMTNRAWNSISLCGWSLGADAASILTMADDPFIADKVCLISNFPEAWHGKLPAAEVRLLVGANEASSRRNWGDYPVERIPGYGHEIGEKIWTDDRYDLLGWLSKG